VQESKKGKPRQISRRSARMPEKSLFYEKVIPALFILLGIVMVILILFAAGVLLGVVPFK